MELFPQFVELFFACSCNWIQYFAWLCVCVCISSFYYFFCSMF